MRLVDKLFVESFGDMGALRCNAADNFGGVCQKVGAISGFNSFG